MTSASLAEPPKGAEAQLKFELVGSFTGASAEVHGTHQQQMPRSDKIPILFQGTALSIKALPVRGRDFSSLIITSVLSDGSLAFLQTCKHNKSS